LSVGWAWIKLAPLSNISYPSFSSQQQLNCNNNCELGAGRWIDEGPELK
jgi:hypothetical protein